jgi:uncharacterized membrane protein YoaK (UPF0700 family)
MSETLFLGALLTVTGGFLDAYTYLCRGKVFANAQTGNIVLLGVKLAEGQFDALLHYLIPILAFALGVVVAELTRRRFRSHPAIHWRQNVIALVIAILGLVALLPTGEWTRRPTYWSPLCAPCRCSPSAKIRGNPCATTMCTTEISAAALSCCSTRCRTAIPHARRRGLQYYAIILLFIRAPSWASGARNSGGAEPFWSAAAFWPWSSAPCSSNREEEALEA